MTDFTTFADYDGDFKNIHIRDTILELVKISEVCRRDGLLAIEQFFDEMKNQFLVQLLQMVVDGTDPARVRSFGKTSSVTLCENYEKYLEVIALSLVNRITGKNLDNFINAYDFTDGGKLIHKIIGELQAPVKNIPSKKYGLFLGLNDFDDEVERSQLFLIMKETCLRHQKQMTDICRKGATSIQMGYNPRVVLCSLQAFTMERFEVN